jgi:hypothetical protein
MDQSNDKAPCLHNVEATPATGCREVHVALGSVLDDRKLRCTALYRVARTAKTEMGASHRGTALAIYASIYTTPPATVGKVGSNRIRMGRVPLSLMRLAQP